uniref:Uncharacterized protein n=1 Tax=Malurus cyaneus samueli TaxID=2593467 RepID=A0A8C5U0I4_9PASS
QKTSQFFSLCFLELCNAMTTDLESYLIVSVIVVGLDSLHQLGKGSFILPVGDSCSLEPQFYIFCKYFATGFESS